MLTDILKLFDDIDKKKTINNAKRLLNSYFRIKRLASLDFEPKVTTTFSLELKNFSNSNINPLEEHLARKDEAKRILIHIYEAINKLNAYDRQLLYMSYLEHEHSSDLSVYMRLNLSERDFYRKKENALLNFSESYNNSDLLVYF